MNTPGQAKTPNPKENSCKVEGSPAKKPTNKVDVTGYPPYTQPQDLTHIFSNYGTVTVEKLSNRFATLNFTRECDAQAALKDSKKIIIYGTTLIVRPHNKNENARTKRVFPQTKKTEVIVSPEQLQLHGNFVQQLDRVLQAVRLTLADASELAKLFADVEAAMQSPWPGCTAMPFGSITTGLGIKTSDADCFINIPPNLKTDNCVGKAKRILQKYPHTFTEILCIPNANTPIVKFFHIPTQTKCDLSFKTPVGVQNSKLIAFLLYSDPRLIPLAVVIKYWAKVCDFSGSPKLSNYSLIMLIIFYLQQPPLPILPPVEWLQRDVSNDIIIDHWNTGFMNWYDQMPRSHNTSSISELLGGFFQYYSTFDFKNNIVCPFLGHIVKKDDFKNFETMPNEFVRYKNNIKNHYIKELKFTTSMVVQDPFEHCHNVTSSITSYVAADIEAFLIFAAKAYTTGKNNQCEEFLKVILLEKPVLPSAKKQNPSLKVTIPSSAIRNVSEGNLKTVIRDIIFVIFEKILKLSLNQVEVEKEPNSNKHKEKYITSITRPIWKRKQLSKLYNKSNLNFLTKQSRITEEIINTDKTEINLKLELMLQFYNDTKNTTVSIKNIQSDPNMFKDFGIFFLSVFYAWFLTLLKPYLTKYDNKKESPESNKTGETNDVDLLQSEGDIRSSSELEETLPASVKD